MCYDTQHYACDTESCAHAQTHQEGITCEWNKDIQQL